jgi:hypothetical protein
MCDRSTRRSVDLQVGATRNRVRRKEECEGRATRCRSYTRTGGGGWGGMRWLAVCCWSDTLRSLGLLQQYPGSGPQGLFRYILVGGCQGKGQEALGRPGGAKCLPREENRLCLRDFRLVDGSRGQILNPT